MPLPPGYFLTWHTYGTWLHGDAAGSVDVQHNTYATSRLPADRDRISTARAKMPCPPYVLSPTARTLVAKVMRDHCALRGWSLAALAVRSNHVHAIIADPTIAPEPIVKQLKEWGTRKLREHHLATPAQRVWADHASTIYLFEHGVTPKLIHYVTELQDAPRDHYTRPNWLEDLA